MSTHTRARCLLLGLLLSLPALAAEPMAAEPAAPPASAVEPPQADIPARRLNLDHTVLGGYNPLVAEYRTRVSYRMRQGQSEDLLWHDTFFAPGAQVRVNPCYTGVGPVVEWQPIAVFNLRAMAEFLGFFGTAGMVQSFRSPADEYSDAVQAARSAANVPYSTLGWHAFLQPTLQAQVGPVALQNVVTLDYWSVRLRGEDTVWYDGGPDTLLGGRGWAFTEEVNLVYLAGPLTVGTTFRYVLPLYTEEHFRPGEDRRAVDNSNMRLGLLGAYTFHDGGYSSFNHPTVFAMASWHLRHRYRAGAETSQAIPFVVVGFSFQQDFIR